MKPVLISLSPNAELTDVWAALVVSWQMWRWRNPAEIKKAAKKLSVLFGGRETVMTSSGRQALKLVMQALDIGNGDEVIIQAFTCVAVPAAVKWAGGKPVYVDIEADTYNMDPADVRLKITSKTKAVVVQHTFGIPARVDELQQIAQENGIVLIEDCAHALGAEFRGKAMGTWGDVAILSFGRDKILSCVFGGAVVSNDVEMMKKIKNMVAALRWPRSGWVWQQLLHPILMVGIKRWYFNMGIGKAMLVLAQKFRCLSKAVSWGERKVQEPEHVSSKMSGALAYLLNKQLDKLEKFNNHRREVAKIYQHDLGSQLILGETGSASWLRYPVRVKNRDEVLRTAREFKMVMGDWYEAVVAPRDVDLAKIDYTVRSCPRAEKASTQIINLPTYIGLDENQVKRVVDFINEKAELV